MNDVCGDEEYDVVEKWKRDVPKLRSHQGALGYVVVVDSHLCQRMFQYSMLCCMAEHVMFNGERQMVHCLSLFDMNHMSQS